MIQIIFGVFFILFGSILISSGIANENDLEKYVLKSDVVECFKDAKWKAQTFQNGNVVITDKYGNEKFYACKEIDTAIEKLNKKLGKE